MHDTESIEQFERLWQVLDEVNHPTSSDWAAWGALPAPGRLPPPWLTWALIAVVRHRRRQMWVGEVVRHRLDGDLAQIATCGALGHPLTRPQSGPVPGLPEWEYYFHGIGCCLTHRVTGESIDVDFFGDHAEGLDFYFFLKYLRSLRRPEPPEERLIQLHPSFEPIRLAFGELGAAGLLTRGPDCGAPRLTKRVVEVEGPVDFFCRAWCHPTQRAWLGARIGDWADTEANLPASADAALRTLVAGRAAVIRRARLELLRQAFDRSEDKRPALQGLNDLGAEDLPELLVRVLRGAVSGVTYSVLEIIDARPDAASWCPEVYQLLQRYDPRTGTADHYLAAHCIRFLLRHGYQTEEVAACLPAIGAFVVGEAALLALEHVPALALGLFRRALRSEVPANRSTAAAVLALIDRPWSRAELLAVLRESDDQEMTSACRAALGESNDQATRRAVEEWQEQNPHEPEMGPFITMAEMSLRHQQAWILYEMDKLRERVAGLSLPSELQA